MFLIHKSLKELATDRERNWEHWFSGRRLGYSSHHRSGCVFLIFVSRLFLIGVLDYIRFGFGDALFYGGRPIWLSGRDGFLSIFFADFCFRETVASSAALSSAYVSGRRWLLQYRYRRLDLLGSPPLDLRIWASSDTLLLVSESVAASMYVGDDESIVGIHYPLIIS